MSLPSTILSLFLAPLLAHALPLEPVPAPAPDSLVAQQVTPTRPSDRRVGLLQTTRDAIVKDMATRLRLPASQLRMTQIQGATFDGCMSIAPRDVACTQIAQFGWQVTVQGGQQRWVYHVLHNQSFKLNGFASVPRSVIQAALRDAARRGRVSGSQLQVNWVEQQTWNNGCLGLPMGGRACTAAQVPGWKVIITHQQQRWVYHTDSARTVHLNEGSQT